MKVQIRFGTFETNSSSTHSLVMLNQEEYDRYERDELFISRYGDIVSKEELDAKIEDEKKEQEKRYKKLWDDPKSWIHKSYSSLEEALNDVDAYSDINYDFDTERMEVIHESKTVDGVTVHALSIYVYDD